MSREPRKLDGSWSGGKGSKARKSHGAKAQLVAALGQRLFWEKDTLTTTAYAALEAEWREAKRDLG